MSTGIHLADRGDWCAFCGDDPALPLPDRGFHYECVLRESMGGIGHYIDHRYWCMVKEDSDMGLSYRQSALRVAEWVKANGLGRFPHPGLVPSDRQIRLVLGCPPKTQMAWNPETT